ncbi:MAG: translation elongation factor Ts [bacterium]|nr:translation elongation factor Ts [bacterium]
MSNAQAIMELRQATGVGVLDAKKALEESGGDVEVAKDALRKQGQAKAAKKSGRETAEGLVGSYIHQTGKLGVLVSVACETDFVARSDDFRALVQDLAMHIAAADPEYVRLEDVPEEIIAKEREIAAAQAAGKPEAVVAKIVDGKLAKFYAERVLLNQEFVKDDSMTVQQRMEQAIQKLGENVVVQEFVRFSL